MARGACPAQPWAEIAAGGSDRLPLLLRNGENLHTIQTATTTLRGATVSARQRASPLRGLISRRAGSVDHAQVATRPRPRRLGRTRRACRSGPSAF